MCSSQTSGPERPRGISASVESKAITRRRVFPLLVALLIAIGLIGQGTGGFIPSTSSISGHIPVFFMTAAAGSNITLSVPSVETVQVGSVLTFTVNATDLNPNRSVYLSAQGLPSGATFPPASGNPIAGTFSWGPTSTQGPGNYTVTFQASYSPNPPLLTKMVLIQVVKALKNLAPLLTVPGPQTITSGTLLSFAVVAEDPNLPPSPVNITAAGLPRGSTFNRSSGIFTWKPTDDQSPGVYILVFMASNQNGIARSRVTITVSGSSGVIPLPQSAMDYLAYAPWITLPALLVSLLYIVQLKRRSRIEQERFIRRPLGRGGKPNEGQAPLFSDRSSQPRPEED